MKIGSPRVEVCDKRLVVSAPIEMRGNELTVWFSYPSALESWIGSDCIDGFVVATYLHAAAFDDVVSVPDGISEELMLNLREYGTVYRSWFPDLRELSFDAPRVTRARYMASRLETSPLSCGVDSLVTLKRRLDESSRRTDGLMPMCVHANVGAHGKGEEGRKLFQVRRRLAEACARDAGVGIVDIDSNLDEVHALTYERSYAARIAGAAMVLQSGISRFRMPSTNRFNQIGPEGSSAVTDHYLSTEIFQTFYDGASMSRIQKLVFLSSWDVARKHLNVCVNPPPDGSNCSICRKCMLTMLMCEISGVRNAFSGVFAFERLDEGRGDFVARMHRRGRQPPNFYWDELCAYAEQNGFEMMRRI